MKVFDIHVTNANMLPLQLVISRRIKRQSMKAFDPMQYPCDQCQYAATRATHLKVRKQSMHEGIRDPCDKCRYSSSAASALKGQIYLISAKIVTFFSDHL